MIRIFFITLLLTTALLVQPASAFNLFGSDVCQGKDFSGANVSQKSKICEQAQEQPGGTAPNANPVVNTLKLAANMIALIGGLLAVIMIIIAGFSMVTSAGNSEQVANSRRRLVSAIVGLLIIALAWIIIRFITDRVLQ